MEIENGKIKIEAYLYSMKAGEVSEIEYKGNLFVLNRSQEVEEAVEEIEQEPSVDVLDKGKVIGHCGTTCIYENVYNTVHNMLSLNKSRREIKERLKKFYPGIKAVSIDAYFTVHKNFKPKKVKRKYKKRRPKNKVGFDKSYQVWIDKEKYEKVKKALHKWNFVATTESLVKETNLSLYEVNAILHYMRDHNKIFRKKKGRVYTYKPTF